MTLLDEKIKQWISTAGWKGVSFGDTGTWARLKLVADNGDFSISIIWNNKDDSTPNYFEIWAHCPIKVPQNRRERISELLMTLNSDRHLTHFTLDYRDGEILCKSVIFSNDDLIFDEKSFKHILNLSLGGMDITFPLIAKLIYSDISIEQALKEWTESLKK